MWTVPAVNRALYRPRWQFFWIYAACMANFVWRSNCPHAWLSSTPWKRSGSGYWSCTRNVGMRWRCVICVTSRPFTEAPTFTCAVGTRRTRGNRDWKQSWPPCLSPHPIILWLHEYSNWSIVFTKPKQLNPSCSSIAGLRPRSPHHIAW